MFSAVRSTSLAVRVVLAVGATMTVVLLGTAIGLLVAAPSAQTGDATPSAVDIGFAQDMSLHHQQAVTMATLARERATDPAVRQLAFDIDTNQRDQIGRMQGWLSLWGQPPQSAGPPMQWMSAEGGHHVHAAMGSSAPLMPGMATSEELQQLQSLRGTEFDVEFLRLMLRHHEGGVEMTEYASQHASVPAVRSLAQNILGAQQTESQLMGRMIAERGAQPLPLR